MSATRPDIGGTTSRATPADSPSETPLTSLASGAGCGCKLPPGELLGLLGRIEVGPRDERLLVGSATSDDAAVFRLSEELALVQTVDFFTPPVDDPFDFGRIAAANALSDVYAMGGTPLTALNIVAFPLELLGASVLARVLEGGAAVAREANVSIVGGHSIEDREPKYGLAVTGVVDPRALVSNAGGMPGDALVLTKPLGVGAAMAAWKRGHHDAELHESAVATMVALNDRSARAAVAAGARAMTDVTGFGLLGHLHHVCRESGLAARLRASAVPCLDGVEQLLADGRGLSGGSRRNAEWADGFARFGESLPLWRRRLLTDPTTSGGLLVAVPAERAQEVPGAVVGELVAGAPGTIDVV
ncbi:MAG TPA: selenide, water dikinase SelD [Solirubrobacteraceae bacterium]|jgi:selenide,water dikinase|nr:selenide, water dikinase SelD [Solirubrobacteraceae bacterium]